MDTRRFLCITAAVFGVMTAAMGSSALAATYAQMPVSDRDGYSVGASSNGPFTLRADGLGSLIVGQGWDSNTYQWHAAMEFDLSGITGTVTSATLKVTADLVANPPAAYRIHGYVGDGSVSAADLTVVNQLGGTYDTSMPYSYDVTSYVNTLVASGQHYVGFNFAGFPGGSGFAMRSSEPYVNSPLLTIVAVPEPATASVGVAAATVLIRRRRR